MEGETVPNLTRIATALGHPVRSFSYDDGMARVVLASGRIAAGIGDTKQEAWDRLQQIVGRG
jgi:hypothetical protein